MQVRNMTEGKPIRLILAVALPLMLGNIFQQMYTVVDAQVVGRVEGVSALAELGASDWFYWMLLGVVLGLAQGFTIPIAQAFGAGDYQALRKNIGNAAVLAAVSSVGLAALSVALIPWVLNLLGTPTEIRPMSQAYLTVLFSAFPVVMGYNFLAGILRSLGDGKSPLYAMIVASLVNIALDLLFVAGFHWGVVGAGVATVIAQICASLFCLHRLSKVDFIRPSREDLKPDRKISSRLMTLGIPIAAQNALIGVGGMILQTVVNVLGVAFIAGYTATNKLYGVLEIAAVSYGYATSTYTGQNLGAGKLTRIRKGVHSSAIAGVLTACLIAAIMLLFGRGIISGFISGDSAEVAEASRIAWEYLFLMSVCLPVLYVLYVYRSALQGMGNTVMPMVSGLAEFVMRTGSALLLPGLIGYPGVFWAEVLAWLGADLILLPSYYLLLSGLRKKALKEGQSVA